MEEHSSLKNKKVSFDESLNLREQLDKYFVNWKWFVLSVFISIIIAFLYLRYTVPLYNAKAAILVRDERKGNVQSELTAFSELGIIKNMKNNVDNEIEIIKSRNIVEKAIKKLNFNIKYSAEGRVKNVELYKDSPIEISFFDTNDLFYKKSNFYTVKSQTESTFQLFKGSNNSVGVFKYGQIINLPDGKAVVSKKPLATKIVDKSFLINVTIMPLDNVVQGYLSKLSVAPISKNSSVVELSISDPVEEKAEDFLNKVVEVYNQDAIDDKNIVSKNTQDFIDERLKYLTQDLGDVEKEGEVYKTNNRITEITEDANLYAENSASFEKNLIETETQIRVINSMITYLNNSAVDDIIPSNIIPSDSNASMMIIQFNELITKRNRVLTSATVKNEIIISLNSQISDTRRNIKESLYRLLESLKIKRNDLKNQEQSLNSKISQIPRQSRELNNIMRQQQIKQTLYLYLMQKREEIGISLAVAAPNAKIVDYAKGSKSPVSPNKMFIILAALAAGFIIPFLVIFIKDLLDTKIKNRQDIESKTNIPFLGDIPKSFTQDEIINASSRSSSAEAIRIVRTNLEFMLNNVPDGVAKTIFVTSTLPKEGKTFVAINLASTIALAGKKVLLVGLDVRNPKIDQYVNIPSKGLTNYLSKQNENIDDYIVKLDNFDNYYVLPSGVIPPNPADLLMSPKLKTLFDKFRQEYDYVIVDTAPVSLVTDTLLVAKFADAFIYVMRANYLDKRLLRVADSFYTEKKLPNMAVLLNDTVWRRTYGYGYGYAYSYGYGYGYGYGADSDNEPKKSSWKDKLRKKQ